VTGAPAHHSGRSFRNPWPNARPQGLLGLLRWVVVERLTRQRRADPSPAAFPRVPPAFDAPRAAPGRLTATWVGQSTFLLQIGGYNVLTDPVWGRRASPVSFAGPARWVPPGIDFDALPPVDLVLVSHDHYDHLDKPTVRRLAERFPAAVWLAPLRLGDWLRARGVRVVREADWWDVASVLGPPHAPQAQHAPQSAAPPGGPSVGTLPDSPQAPAPEPGDAAQSVAVQVTCVPAQHFSGRWAVGRNTTLWCGWALHAGGRRVLFTGDTGRHPEFAAIAGRCGPFDLVLVPIGAYEPRWFMRPVHMNPEDAVAVYAELCGPTFTAPPRPLLAAMHWGTFKLTDEPMDEPPRRMRAAWRSAGFDDRSLWVPAHGETRVVTGG